MALFFKQTPPPQTTPQELLLLKTSMQRKVGQNVPTDFTRHIQTIANDIKRNLDGATLPPLPRTQAWPEDIQQYASDFLLAVRNAGKTVMEKLPELIRYLMDLAKDFSSRMMQQISRANGIYDLLVNYNHYFALFIYLLLVSVGLRSLAEAMMSIYLCFCENGFLKIIGYVGIGNIAMSVLPRTQGLDLQHLIPLACLAVAGVVGYATKNILPSDYAKFAATMDSHRKIFMSVKTFGPEMAEFVKKALSTFGFTMIGLDPNLEEELPSDMSEFASRLRAFDIGKRRLIETDIAVANEAYRMYDDWMILRTKYRENRPLSALLDKSQGICVNLQTAAMGNTQLVIKQRVEPVILMFRGGSGVGKSTLMYHFGAAVLAEEGVITEQMDDAEITRKVETCIYPRAAETEYWEGYRNTPVTLVDDAFQMVDSTSNPCLDYMELIRMGNGFPYPLHMASIANKTNNNFTSRAVIYTTNVERLNPASLISQEAVCRRVTLPFEVKLKAGIRLDELDVDAGIRTDIYDFYPWNVTSGGISAAAWSFEDVMSAFKQKLAAHKRKFQANQRSVATYARTLFPRQEAPVVQSLFSWLWVSEEATARHQRRVQEVRDQTVRQRNYQIASDHFDDILTTVIDALRRGVEPDLPPGDDIVELFVRREGYDHVQALVNRDRIFAEYRRAMRVEEIVPPVEERQQIAQERAEQSQNEAVAVFDSHRTITLGILANIAIVVAMIGFWKFVSAMQKSCTVDLVDEDFPEKQELMDLQKRINLGYSATFSDARLVKRYRAYLTDKNKEDPEFVKTESAVEAFATAESGKARKRPPRTEAWACNNAKDICEKVRRNQVLIYVSREGAAAVDPIKALMVCGQRMIINKHYVYRLNREELLSPVTLKICVHGSTKGLDVLWSDVRKTEQNYGWNDGVNDISILTIDKMQRFPNITQHFTNLHDYETLKGRRLVMVLPNELKFGTIEKTLDHEYLDTTGERFAARGFVSNISSAPGDCGSAYVLDDSTAQRRIVGFHFCGELGKAYGVPLIQELLHEEGEDYDAVPPLVNGNILFLGKAKLNGKPYRHFGPTQTKLRQTKMFNSVIESPNQPAYLSYDPNGTILKDAVAKQSGDVPVIDPAILEEAVSDYEQMLPRMPQFEVLSFREAVKGKEGSEYISGICRSTSAGFPYSQQTRKKGKTEWFGSDEWTFGPKAMEVKAEIEEKIKIAEQGGQLTFIFTDTLKDETRPVEKVRKPRLFAAAPMDFIIMFRMYFMSFLAYMMENRIENESAVGIRSQSMEWDILARKLTDHPHIVAGDFSNYDGTLHPDILWAIYRMIERFYLWSGGSDEDAKVRKELWVNITQSTHLVNDMFYRVNHSQPSGNPATAILNSIYNSIACRYVYLLTTPRDIPFFQNVSMIAYGDDNVLSISHAAITSFNQLTMSEGFEKIGMRYTNESKTTSTLPWRNITDVSFLKRSFRMENGTWYGPLTIVSILDCFNWIHETRDEFATIEANAINAGIELALHDHKTWEYYSTLISKAIFQTYGKVCRFPSRHEILYQIREGKLHEYYTIQWI